MEFELLNSKLSVAENDLATTDARIVFMVKLGQALHRYGVPAHRLEQGMNLVAQRFGIQGSFFVTPTGIFASFGLPEEHRTSLIRIESSDDNLEKLARLDELTSRVIRGQVNVAEGTQAIDRIVAAPAMLPQWTLWVALVIAPLTFAVLFNARLRDLGWIMPACWLSFGGARAGAYLFGPELGVCIGAIFAGACGNLYARWLDRPAAIPLVPAIMLLVPGSLGLSSLAKFIEKDVMSGVMTAFSMILIAVALVTGLLMANVIVPPRKML